MLTVDERRSLLIDIIVRQQQPGSGSCKEFLLKRTAEMKWTDLTKILSPITWAVIGAVATRHYMPERTTKDLDCLISSDDGNAAREKFLAAGFEFQSELTIGGSSWLTPDGKAIDVIESRNEWVEEAIHQAQHNRDLQGLPILPLQYLALMKYQAGRPQDIADITRMLGQANETMLLATRNTFLLWMPSALKDLESLIRAGKLEML
ncbi:MAG: hypothetical protein EPO24_03540 [Bacteroidetes bacterium]|nr:MAG: hypothetical protein EPO24_03540 [Bacteroidota bacterium]